MSSHIRYHKGFTLVELLVVMAVIAALVAILLPAVQNAREAARRTECRNNMHQIAVGLQNYHQKHRRLPPGWVGVTNNQHDVNGLSGLGWAAMILPEMDQTPAWDKINRNESITSAANGTIRGTVISTYRCPSDSASVTGVWQIALEPPKVNPDLPVNLPLANYVGCYGSTDLHACEDDPIGSQCVGNGCFYLNSSVRIDSIKDGTTTTILFAERRTNEKMSPQWYSTWLGAASGGEEAIARILGSTDHKPNSTVHIEDFSSAHGEGIFVGLADGGVKFVSNDIDPDIFKGLGTIAGKEASYDF